MSGKATPEEIKEKMEQQLRIQRAAHQQKRALETYKNQSTNSTSPATQLVKVTANSSHGKLHEIMYDKIVRRRIYTLRNIFYSLKQLT